MFDTSHFPVSDYIDGDAFEGLAIPGVSYYKTDHVKAALESHSVRGVLVTHNSDLGADAELASIGLVGSGITYWFAQNVVVRHPKLIPIPIGLERKRWFPRLHKRDQLHDAAEKSLTTPSRFCLANFSLHTNRIEREKCRDRARPLSTMQVSETVYQETYESYSRYLSEILRHKFVLCPEGNGVDTHRLWETLYLGRIPVVIRSPTTEAFKDLPMVVINSWDDLSPSMLEDYWERFKSGEISYDLAPLRMSYWRDLITIAAAEGRRAP